MEPSRQRIQQYVAVTMRTGVMALAVTWIAAGLCCGDEPDMADRRERQEDIEPHRRAERVRPRCAAFPPEGSHPVWRHRLAASRREIEERQRRGGCPETD